MSNRNTRSMKKVAGKIGGSKKGNEKASASSARGNQRNDPPNPYPFKFEDDDEKNLYLALCTRDVCKPHRINMEFWRRKAEEDEDKCAKYFVKKLELLELVNWADVDLPGYRNLMLEFFTTCKLNDDGSFVSRFRDIAYTTSVSDIRKICLFYDGPDRRKPVGDYNKAKWWEELTRSLPEPGCRFQASEINRPWTFLAYKFMTQAFGGKEDVSRMSEQELYSLWVACKGGHANLVHILEMAIKNVQKVSPSRSAKLTLGAFVTSLATYHGVQFYENDTIYPAQDMVVDKRKYKTKEVVIPTFWKRGDAVDEGANFGENEEPVEANEDAPPQHFMHGDYGEGTSSHYDSEDAYGSSRFSAEQWREQMDLMRTINKNQEDFARDYRNDRWEDQQAMHNDIRVIRDEGRERDRVSREEAQAARLHEVWIKEQITQMHLGIQNANTGLDNNHDYLTKMDGQLARFFDHYQLPPTPPDDGMVD